MSDDTAIEEYEAPLPCWRFSLWDVAGIAVATVGGFFTVVGQASQMLHRELAAAANYSRQNYEFAESERLNNYARQQMAESLRKITDGES